MFKMIDEVLHIHITEVVDGVRLTHTRLATAEEIVEYNELCQCEEKQALVDEHKECTDYLDQTRWVHDKQLDGFDVTKHQSIIDERVAKRNRMNEIQTLLSGTDEYDQLVQYSITR